MSYYMQGDFYGRGGYYRGDPGFFSFLGGVAKSAVGLIPGVGPMLSAGLGALGRAKPASAIVKGAEASPAAAGLAHTAGKMLGTAVRQHPVLTAAGAAGGLLGAGAAAGALARGRMGARMAMPGMHKRRRMNACNPRALRRAIRRAHAFERLAKKVIGFSSPRKPRGHMYFKKKRKR